MTEHSVWRISRALHAAINDGEISTVGAVLDDEIDWAIYGPIDMFPFLGARRGREAVVDVLSQIADNVRVSRFDRETMMLGGGAFGNEQAASLIRCSLTARDSNKPISVRAACFAQFNRRRLSCMRILLDTFDLVEQALGQPIHLPSAI